MSNKDVQRLLAVIAREPGWEVRRTARIYHLVYDPRGEFVIRIPSTPSGRAFYRRTKRALTKAGFPWPS